jgi:flagellar biosynthesis protein FlhF
MKVKRYVVDDVPEAVQMIRNELGSDAVILNTKEIRTGGFLGMFRKKRFEVIAAVDDTSRKPAARPPQSIRSSAPASAPKPAVLQNESPSAGSPLPPQTVRRLYAQTNGAETARANSAAQAAIKQLPEVPAPVQPTLKSPVPVREADETFALLEELRSMKEMMARLTRQQAFSSMPESVLKWSRRLAEQGVDPIHVEQFAEEVRIRLEESRDPSDASGYRAATEVLRSWLAPFAGGGIGEGTRIVHFVGPTGVGKTTTIAKLAAEQSFAHRRKVGLITADTYRISAVDQLRTYADILNVPMEVVFSPGELTRAFHKLADRDLLFMDTAGRNYRNELYVSEVNSLLSSDQEAETFLVLSMTHKYSDMKEIVAQFAKYGIRRLLLTKSDETSTFGSMVNLVRDFRFPIAYVTCGQTVPDDIRVFNPEEWVIKLLGDPDHE